VDGKTFEEKMFILTTRKMSVWKCVVKLSRH
jgi:hypothetical protein